MPELPEVESLRRLLARSTAGRKIVGVTIRDRRLRRPVTSGFKATTVGRRIVGIARRGKYLVFELSGDRAILFHLGMSGTLTHREPADRVSNLDPRHDHIDLVLDDGSRLVLNDPRRFGMAMVVSRGRLASIPELHALGPDALSREFSPGYLTQQARGRRVAVKNLLMDQRVVAGIGNIYAAEILFRAGIRPTRRAGRLTRAESARIVAATRPILRHAIGRGGTTFRSYMDSSGRPGGFAPRLKVYGREGRPCPACSGPIRRVIIGQRASFYCPACQR